MTFTIKAQNSSCWIQPVYRFAVCCVLSRQADIGWLSYASGGTSGRCSHINLCITVFIAGEGFPFLLLLFDRYFFVTAWVRALLLPEDQTTQKNTIWCHLRYYGAKIWLVKDALGKKHKQQKKNNKQSSPCLLPAWHPIAHVIPPFCFMFQRRIFLVIVFNKS